MDVLFTDTAPQMKCYPKYQVDELVSDFVKFLDLMEDDINSWYECEHGFSPASKCPNDCKAKDIFKIYEKIQEKIQKG